MWFWSSGLLNLSECILLLLNLRHYLVEISRTFTEIGFFSPINFAFLSSFWNTQLNFLNILFNKIYVRSEITNWLLRALIGDGRLTWQNILIMYFNWFWHIRMHLVFLHPISCGRFVFSITLAPGSMSVVLFMICVMIFSSNLVCINRTIVLGFVVFMVHTLISDGLIHCINFSKVVYGFSHFLFAV